ncbi:centrosomal protein of 44 kDa isoform X2 [Bufo bufo]|uniref:centrosomal protein of 44 kDa isoform X2 n=1 Tax=Bufo bufo TaxID=8384 RepID=UPI001ABDC816|nr:centrosomal protein of 44 kDa isoform X2 [Bufo bufo]
MEQGRRLPDCTGWSRIFSNNMTTGDVKGVLRKLEQKLRLLNYPRDVDYSGLVKGDPAAALPIISYTFTAYSTWIAEILVSLDIELSAKSDLRFIDAVYKVLRDVFHYKPVLTKQQFLQCGFSERRMQTVCDIIDCVVKKHKEIANQSKAKLQPVKRTARIKDKCEAFYPEETCAQPSVKPETVNQKKIIVERHTGTNLPPSTLPVASGQFVSSTEEELSTSDSEAEEPSMNEVTKDTQIDLLKAQLAECQEKLSRIDWMEDRLQALETSMKGKIIIDETDWNNLLSRVLLLETDRLLQLKKRDLTSEFTSISEERTSSRMTSLHIKADLPENNHQSSGYSSLPSAGSSPAAIDLNYSNSTEDSQESTKQRMDRLTKMLEETSKLLKFSNSS